MRSAGGHLRTYLQLENEQTPWISPAVSTPHWGLSREVSCLSRQNELDGHRPTDVTGSPRSAQKSRSPGSGRDCSLPNKLAAMLFFAIAPLFLRGTVLVQTGSPRAFEFSGIRGWLHLHPGVVSGAGDVGGIAVEVVH